MPDLIAVEPGGPECGCELVAVLGERDRLLVPHRCGDDFLGYLGDLLGSRLSAGNLVVTGPALDDGRAAAELRAGDLGARRLVPYRPGRGVLALADDLGLPLAGVGGDTDAACRRFLRFGGAEALDGPAGLHLLAGAVGAPLAPGRPVATEHGLCSAVRALLPVAGRVLVRRDSGRGEGLVVTVHDEIRDERHPIVRVPGDDCDFAFLAAELWPLLSDHGGADVLVEVHRRVLRAHVAEFWVPGPAVPPELLGVAERRPGVAGLEVPGGTLTAALRAELTSHSVDVAAEAGRRGYAGALRVDSVVTGDGWFVTGVRAGAGRHGPVARLARALAGPDHARDRVLLTRAGIKVRDFPTAVAALEIAEVAYDRPARTGVAVTVDATACRGEIGWLVAGRDAAHAARLEQRALAALRMTWSCAE
ncbi:peptide ligase PGM1-related protein [Amycolatopsis sp. NPDC003861]